MIGRTMDTGGAIPGPAYAIPPQVYFREVDGQMVLLNLETEEYYGLDAVGADIVNRLTSAPWDDAMSALEADYDVDPAVLRSDIARLLGDLTGAGLIERADGGPA